MANDPFYRQPAWRRVRRDYLAAHPACSTRGCPAPATEVDHVVARAAGGADYAWTNLRSTCKSCHSRKTAAVDGSFGRARCDGPPPDLRAKGCDADGNPFGGWG